MIGKNPITTLDAFQLMLIYLKLTGAVDWGWIYVLAPILLILSSWLVLNVLKETLITLNAWLIGGRYDEQERQTDERDEVHCSSIEAEERWSDSEADERGTGDTDQDSLRISRESRE